MAEAEAEAEDEVEDDETDAKIAPFSLEFITVVKE